MELKAKTTIETYNTLVEKLRKNKKLYFTRFGDGELLLMMGENTRNSNFNKELQKELIECFTIEHPQFLIASVINQKKERGMSEGLFTPYSFNTKLKDFIINNGYENKLGIYENPITFHYLTVFQSKLIFNFLENYVRPRKKMFIGSINKDVTEKLYGYIDYYISIPKQFAYDTIDEWWPDIIKNIDHVELVIPSAGSASKVISKRLWKLNKEIHLLDIGSIIDAVDGKVSRTWIRLQGHKINKVLPKQYREKRINKRIGFILKNMKCFFRSFIK